MKHGYMYDPANYTIMWSNIDRSRKDKAEWSICINGVAKDSVQCMNYSLQTWAPIEKRDTENKVDQEW